MYFSDDSTNRYSIRIVYTSVMITALLLNSIYSATLLKQLMSFEVELPINDLDEMINDGSYRWITIDQSDFFHLMKECYKI